MGTREIGKSMSRLPDIDWEINPKKDHPDSVQQERERIWEAVERLYKNSEATRTPIYQDRMYAYLKNILWPQHPPQHFRDASNGE